MHSPTKQETQLAIQKLNNNIALGIDSIPVELLKRKEKK
jgi:hypothetical protein